MKRVFNFSAGPAVLPTEVLQQVKEELCDWQGVGSSVMEVSHRGKEFVKLAEESIIDLKELLNIPPNYRVLFAQGGARGQFSAIPLNLVGTKGQADYINSGYWSKCAAEEAQRYCQVNENNVVRTDNGIKSIASMKEWQLSDSDYLHYCTNETVDGMMIYEKPSWSSRVVVADMSSEILSRPIDINDYDLIYAGAQKNIGPAGLTLIIVKDELLGRAHKHIPSVLDYQILAKHDSMFNTPPTFTWYLASLVFKWLKKQGGITAIDKVNKAKATLLYKTIDESDFYRNNIASANRSTMNIVFQLKESALDSVFIEEAAKAGITNVKGHKVVGGMRTSIYNAMPLEGVETLTLFMKEFEKKKG